MNDDDLLKLNIHITGKEVTKLAELTEEFIKLCDTQPISYEESLYEFAKQLEKSIQDTLEELRINKL